MSPAGEKRIRRGVLVGLIVMMLAVYSTMALSVGIGRSSLKMLLACLVIAAATAWPVGRLAAIVARRVNELRLIDTLAATFVLLIVLQVAVMVSVLSQPARIVDGEPCNGTGRKLVMPGPAGGPTYWGCVTAEEYAAQRAAEPVPTVPGIGVGDRVAEIYQRLAKVNFASRSVGFGTVAALAGWLYAFGWRWRIGTDEL